MQHTWKIYDLKRTISDGVVTEVTYACESNEAGFGTRKIGELIVVGSADNPDFVAYEDLTEAIVLGWVTGSVDTASIETQNSSSIAEIISYEQNKTKDEGIPW